MLIGGELKGELARIQPARECCRRAELAGLTYGDAAVPVGRAHPRAPEASERDESLVELRTLDPATARVAVNLAGGIGALRGDASGAAPRSPAGRGRRRLAGDRRRLRVTLDAAPLADWSWSDAPACDRRAFLRGMLLGAASISFSSHGPHVEFVFRDARRAEEARRRLRDSDVRAAVLLRRGRRVVYVKGREEVATLLRLAGANRSLLDFETDRVGREVRGGLNRLLNAEAANLGRTVSAAGRQLESIDRLERAGGLSRLSSGLREAAIVRRRNPEADLDAIARLLGVSRSAANHRLRRLVEIAQELDASAARRG